jgi:heparan-alpha-glucosaminide N-acetyltransferase
MMAPIPLAPSPATPTYSLAVSSEPVEGTPQMAPAPVIQPQLAQPQLVQLRLASLDAYRGFVMLAMASSGFGFSTVVRQHPELVTGEATSAWSQWLWRVLAYQFDHVAWTGCAFWDLIQPSFMFMVGVSLPFSAAKRTAEGSTALGRWLHAVWRSLVLVLLGIFLSSNGAPLTNFTYVNVLTQIGLGYPLLYLMNGRHWAAQLLLALVILGGYWGWFARTGIEPETETLVRQYATEVKNLDEAVEFDQFTGFAGRWNKHTNAAAGVDRWLLNVTPRPDEPWNGKAFWLNAGGYQTLNFVPSLATMLFGLMAGTLLRSSVTPGGKVLRLLLAGVVCFAVSMAVDTSIWPVQVAGCDWSYCPIVKRIWTPTWALFSTGWALSMLAAFYWVMDVRGYRGWAFPFMVVGMNSIAMYVFAQLLKPWWAQTLKTHFATLDRGLGWSLVPSLFEGTYAPITSNLAVLLCLWLMCWWMWRQRIFVKV